MDAEAPTGLRLHQSNPKTTNRIFSQALMSCSKHKMTLRVFVEISSYLMLQEECFELAFGPVVHGVGQQLHGEGVHP